MNHTKSIKYDTFNIYPSPFGYLTISRRWTWLGCHIIWYNIIIVCTIKISGATAYYPYILFNNSIGVESKKTFRIRYDHKLPIYCYRGTCMYKRRRGTLWDKTIFFSYLSFQRRRNIILFYYYFYWPEKIFVG